MEKISPDADTRDKILDKIILKEDLKVTKTLLCLGELHLPALLALQ